MAKIVQINDLGLGEQVLSFALIKYLPKGTKVIEGLS